MTAIGGPASHQGAPGREPRGYEGPGLAARELPGQGEIRAEIERRLKLEAGRRLQWLDPRPLPDSDPFYAVVVREQSELLRRALEAVPPRELLVLRRYYFEGMTHSQIGKLMGVTPDRVRQIKSKAFHRMLQRLIVSGLCNALANLLEESRWR